MRDTGKRHGAVAGLHRYSGSRPREHAAGAERRAYGLDQTGTNTYRFNSLGFRCDEFDPRAAATVFVCGCSDTIGTGLNIDDTWVNRFRELHADALALARDDVNVLNFAEGGASADYIARTLLTQMEHVEPALVIAQFGAVNRAEGFIRGRPFSMGPWLLPGASLVRRFLAVPWREKRAALRRMRKARHYARYYSSALGLSNALRNILLVQLLCHSRDIPCLISWPARGCLTERSVLDDPVLGPLARHVDRLGVLDFSIRDVDVHVDVGADGRHPGPRSHALFAERMAASVALPVVDERSAHAARV